MNSYVNLDGANGDVPRPMPWHFDVAVPPVPAASKARPRPKGRVVDDSPERQIGGLERKTIISSSEAVARADPRHSEHEYEHEHVRARARG